MLTLSMARPGERLRILCLGAHSDDIEIGAGGTILQLIGSGVRVDVTWCVLSGGPRRATEAERSASAFLEGAAAARVRLGAFSDSHFPSEARELKEWLLEVRAAAAPDLVFTHAASDAHQDHREVSRLTWNVFRDALILEYEIPKWDGDLGQPNAYAAISEDVLERKIELLTTCFETQAEKDWFDPDTFRGLARLRGAECRAPERFAEAFTMRKARLA